MTATTAFFHFAKKIHNRRRIPENPRIVAVGDVRGHHYSGGHMAHGTHHCSYQGFPGISWIADGATTGGSSASWRLELALVGTHDISRELCLYSNLKNNILSVTTNSGNSQSGQRATKS